MHDPLEDTQPIPVVTTGEPTRALPRVPQDVWRPTPPATSELPPARPNWSAADRVRITAGWALMGVLAVLALLLVGVVVVPFVGWLPGAVGGALAWAGSGLAVLLLIFLFIFVCLFG